MAASCFNKIISSGSKNSAGGGFLPPLPALVGILLTRLETEHFDVRKFTHLHYGLDFVLWNESPNRAVLCQILDPEVQVVEFRGPATNEQPGAAVVVTP